MRAVLVACLLAVLILLAAPITARGDCEPEPASQWAPAGFVCGPHFGEGWASRYAGQFAAMNFCSWEVRHSTGCGMVRITSHDTGLQVITEVGEWCMCWVGVTGPNGETERLIDLTPGLVSALGLRWEDGMYRVTVERYPPRTTLPDTKIDGCRPTEPPPQTSGSTSKRLIPAGFGAELYGAPDTARSCVGARTSTPTVTPMSWSKAPSLAV